MEEKIRKAVEEALVKMGARGVSFTVERPTDSMHGDYTTNVAMKVFGPISHSNLSSSGKVGSSKMYQWHPILDKYKNPRELADSLAQSLIESLGASVASHVSVAGPGFVNITLAREAVALAVAEANAKGEDWGRGSINVGKHVLIEYTDPNPFKEMHIGHLMSNSIGEAIARLIEYTGADVKRANYQGDVGLHVAKAIFVKKRSPEIPWSAAYKMGNDLYEAFREEIDEINKKIYYRSDKDINALYNKGVLETLKEFEIIYEKLNMKSVFSDTEDKIHFDFYFFESLTWKDGVELVKNNTPKIFTESDGAIVFHAENYNKNLHTRVFITSQGLPTYETKELGLMKLKQQQYREKFKTDFDISITVTANEQKEYFKVVLMAAKQIEELSEVVKKTMHIVHGMMRFANGKMSSRTGNVITALSFLQDLFGVAKERAEESRTDDYEKLAHDIALAAAKYQILKQASGKDIIFDPEKSLSLEGDSGPYLQYALVRAKSVIHQAASRKQEAGGQNPETPYLLERIILHFPEVTARAARELAPNLLVNYLTELAGEWNSFYAQERIIGADDEAHKLLVASAFVNTMSNGLTLLGIPTPEKM